MYIFSCFRPETGFKKSHEYLRFKRTGKTSIVNGETNCAACGTNANVLLSLCTLCPGACEEAPLVM